MCTGDVSGIDHYRAKNYSLQKHSHDVMSSFKASHSHEVYAQILSRNKDNYDNETSSNIYGDSHFSAQKKSTKKQYYPCVIGTVMNPMTVQLPMQGRSLHSSWTSLPVVTMRG